METEITNPFRLQMINVSDTCVAAKKNSYDFEEYTSVSMEIDSWTTTTNDKGLLTATHTSTTATTSVNDDSIINIFSQSIELFGASIAPWPAAKSIPEQVAGIFLTSESISPKDEPVQSRLEANKPQIQSKLRRSTSTSRRISITRINEENYNEAQKIYNELEPIPIVSADRTNHPQGRSPSKVSVKDAENIPETHKERSRSSRLQSWLASLYTRGTNNTAPFSSTKDEETGLNANEFARKPFKGILKRTLTTETVQKTVTIPETEDITISETSTDNPKKTMKLRFDNEVCICETFHKEDYSRQSLDYVARQLTPTLALQIKKELNSVKQEMEIHDESRHLTQFYLIK